VEQGLRPGPLMVDYIRHRLENSGLVPDPAVGRNCSFGIHGKISSALLASGTSVTSYTMIASSPARTRQGIKVDIVHVAIAIPWHTLRQVNVLI
jgi:hypothetical protein